MARNRSQRPRDYLGGSRVGEPCERKLVYEVTHTPKDPGADFEGPILRVFDVGHAFEALSIRWLREAGFDLRDQRADGRQFGFEAAGGRLRGHIDGVIVAGPEIGVRWPALWEHKALNAKSWTDVVKRGLRLSKPIYFAQVQLYMAYMELGVALFTALNKDSQALHHEIVPFEPAEAQALSDRAVAIIRAADAGELPPRMASAPDFYLCRMCAWSQRCWEDGPHDASVRHRNRPAPSPASRTGSGIAAASSRCSASSAMPGSGKSTLTAHAIAELGLDGEGHALGSRRCALCRLHRQGGAGDDPQGHAGLDHPQPDLPLSRRRLRRRSRASSRISQDLRAGLGAMGPGERLFAETQIRHLELRLRDLHEPRFLLNEQSLLRDADLLVLDEVSMVGHEMAADLLAFGKPILVLGDPGQLPPIKGEGAFTRGEPDVMLTEIHRQAGRERDRPPCHPGAAGPADPLRRA